MSKVIEEMRTARVVLACLENDQASLDAIGRELESDPRGAGIASGALIAALGATCATTMKSTGRPVDELIQAVRLKLAEIEIDGNTHG
jgi:hypothetical protein